MKELTEKEMTKTVQNRVAEMIKEPEIQQIMLNFKTQKEAQDYIIKAAIATLCLSVNERINNT